MRLGAGVTCRGPGRPGRRSATARCPAAGGAFWASALAATSSSCRPRVSALRMRIERPSERAASGRRFAPNNSTKTTTSTIMCHGLSAVHSLATSQQSDSRVLVDHPTSWPDAVRMAPDLELVKTRDLAVSPVSPRAARMRFGAFLGHLVRARRHRRGSPAARPPPAACAPPRRGGPANPSIAACSGRSVTAVPRSTTASTIRASTTMPRAIHPHMSYSTPYDGECLVYLVAYGLGELRRPGHHRVTRPGPARAAGPRPGR